MANEGGLAIEKTGGLKRGHSEEHEDMEPADREQVGFQSNLAQELKDMRAQQPRDKPAALSAARAEDEHARWDNGESLDEVGSIKGVFSRLWSPRVKSIPDHEGHESQIGDRTEQSSHVDARVHRWVGMQSGARPLNK